MQFHYCSHLMRMLRISRSSVYSFFLGSSIILCGCGVRKTILPDRIVNSGALIETAVAYKGVPYTYGGSTPEGFDCSGFLFFVFNRHGISLSRTVAMQSRSGRKVTKSHLKPGDIVFFHTRGIFTRPTHAGLYIGNGNFIHAGSLPPAYVRIDSLDNPYYKRRFLFGRKVF